MAKKHAQVLKDNFAVALRQMGLPSLEKVIRIENAKRVSMPLVWEVCTECGNVKKIGRDGCKTCREAKVDKKIKQKSHENFRKYKKRKKVATTFGWK